MSLILMALAAAATHNVSVEHHGNQVGATYTARADIHPRHDRPWHAPPRRRPRNLMSVAWRERTPS